ncbi:hypothetical protein C7B65_04180 [Phormidesmis priestleyi ULC007]|uniref:DUF928 domain-containing protein n=1 Tax=Phormidesmis priestleyi ULC007 TaxID=1920490 RepID=A0A2T1DL19_9CYAN|nr:DUF928 domain-containing protein [Phormidesmis priestleyi]PSB21145.1 hypothetical protein C7B65_04180 [Phormidesmis priestleyi ULC007]PZO51330.1 MAG: DUF928 domain-containing protein [Phormidesmis priestleyi]
MPRPQRRLQPFVLAFVVAVACVGLPLGTEAQPARESWVAQSLIDRLRWIFFPPKTSNRGAPSGRRKGGATHGICPTPLSAIPLTALVPASPTPPDQPMGATLSDHPTFWFYVPYSARLQRPIEFVLIDEQENDVYTRTFLTTDIAKPGVISLSLPKTVPALQVGQSYRWVLSVICDRGNRSGDITINGWIQRVQPDATLTTQLKQATTPEQRLSLYADHGLWYDTLTTLAELRRQRPTDLAVTANWDTLLQSVELETIAPEPLSPCCKLAPVRDSANRPAK